MFDNTLTQTLPRAADWLQSRFRDLDSVPFFLQTGTGFEIDGILDEVIDEEVVHAMPGMPDSHSPAGHNLRFVRGHCDDTEVLICQGRRHVYEGDGIDPCVLPVGAAVRCGIRNTVFTNAVGGIAPTFKPGTLVALTDFVNHMGLSPLIGCQELAVSPFPDMTTAFSQELLGEFVNAAAEVGVDVRLGVYWGTLGPQFETPAEIEMARQCGGDVVGMSTVCETIVANAMGANVLGISLVSNAAAATGRPVKHEDFWEIMRLASEQAARALNVFFRDWQTECPAGEPAWLDDGAME